MQYKPFYRSRNVIFRMNLHCVEWSSPKYLFSVRGYCIFTVYSIQCDCALSFTLFRLLNFRNNETKDDPANSGDKPYEIPGSARNKKQTVPEYLSLTEIPSVYIYIFNNVGKGEAGFFSDIFFFSAIFSKLICCFKRQNINDITVSTLCRMK